MFTIFARFVSILIGYLLGTFQTGYLYGKSQGVDIRKHGSGNSGSTNSLRVIGKKAGAITLAGDCLKAIISVVIVYFIFRSSCQESIKLLELYAGFGAVLGHNFPFFLKFKGGKGVACTGGTVLAVCPIAAPISLGVFVLTVIISKYVSLGSILALVTLLVQVLIFNYFDILHVGASCVIEFNIVVACFAVLGIWQHRANIKRLISGTENKIGQKAK